MSYTLLRGEFVIRYPDLPRQGPEPDGDTVKFLPDTPALVEALPRRSGRPPDINARGISVRLEAVDALETHFQETHQQLKNATAARDRLLERLGFTNVTYFRDSPNKVQSSDQDALRGHVLTNGIDANGRLIAFVYAGDHAGPDGSSIFAFAGSNPALPDFSQKARERRNDLLRHSAGEGNDLLRHSAGEGERSPSPFGGRRGTISFAIRWEKGTISFAIRRGRGRSPSPFGGKGTISFALFGGIWRARFASLHFLDGPRPLPQCHPCRPFPHE